MCQDQGKSQKWRSVSFKSRAELSSKIELSSVLSEKFYVQIELRSRSALSTKQGMKISQDLRLKAGNTGLHWVTLGSAWCH